MNTANSNSTVKAFAVVTLCTAASVLLWLNLPRSKNPPTDALKARENSKVTYRIIGLSGDVTKEELLEVLLKSQSPDDRNPNDVKIIFICKIRWT
jgi:hypothetical protein